MDIIVKAPIYNRNGIGGKSFYTFEVFIKDYSSVYNLLGIIDEDQVYEKDPDMKLINPKDLTQTFIPDEVKHEIKMKVRDYL
jgi:hypothetical protein